MAFCKCGCGIKVNKTWARGHWLKVSSNSSRVGKLGADALTDSHRKNMAKISADKRRGKTLEKIHGVEVANRIKNILSETHSDKLVSEDTRKKLREHNLGKKHSAETRKKMSESHKKNTHMIGKTNPVYRDDVRDKLRKKRTEQLLNAGSTASYNIDACKIFDKINEEFKLNGIHALNGGEKIVSGYWLDYYEPDLNLVIEYDEKHHFNKDGELKKRDILRQDKIKKELNCKFIRIKFDENLDSIINKLKEEIVR